MIIDAWYKHEDSVAYTIPHFFGTQMFTTLVRRARPPTETTAIQFPPHFHGTHSKIGKGM